MKFSHSTRLLPVSLFAVLAMAALPATAAVVVTSIGANSSDKPTLSMNVLLDGSGTASTGSGDFSAVGSVTESGAFGGTFGVTLTAMKNVSTDLATLGDQITSGLLNVNGTLLGISNDPNGGGIGYDASNREGITFSLNTATGISPTVGVQITDINVQAVGRDGTDPADESFWIVNLLTRQSLHITPALGSAGNFDVSSLNLTLAGGSSLTDVAAIYSGDVGGFRVAGLTLAAIPEPASALLGGLGMLTLLRRRRA